MSGVGGTEPAGETRAEGYAEAGADASSAAAITTPSGPTDVRGWIAYDFAVLRVVPHPHLGSFVPVGVVVHARTEELLLLRAITDPAELAHLLPTADTGLLARYLDACVRICDGDADAGPIALLPSSERFHWITAPRSDVIQCGPVHEGLSESPERAVEELFVEYVLCIPRPEQQGEGG